MPALRCMYHVACCYCRLLILRGHCALGCDRLVNVSATVANINGPFPQSAQWTSALVSVRFTSGSALFRYIELSSGMPATHNYYCLVSPSPADGRQWTPSTDTDWRNTVVSRHTPLSKAACRTDGYSITVDGNDVRCPPPPTTD